MYYQIFLDKTGSKNLIGRYETDTPVSKDEIISLIDNKKLHKDPVKKEHAFYKVKMLERKVFQGKGTSGVFFKDCSEVSLIIEELTLDEIKEIITLV